MQRVRKLVSAPDDIAGGQAKVTIAVLDTGERVTLMHSYVALPSESASEQDPIVTGGVTCRKAEL